MRLDHLLSTEFFRTPVGVRSVARMPETVFGGCGRAGVEEIVGFAGSLGGLRGVVRICFWVPGPPPATFGRVRFSGCPWRDAVGLWAAGRVLSGRVVV